MTLNLHLIGLTGLWLLQAVVSVGSQAVIAAYFGTSASLDAYLVGITLPTTIYMIASTGLGAAATVYFNQVKAREGEAAAYQSISGLLIMVIGGGIILGAVLLMEADWLVASIAPGLIIEVRDEAVLCLQLTSLSLPFLGVFSLLTGLLNAQHMFFVTSVAGIVLVGLAPLPLLLSAQVSSEALAWGFNAGAFGGSMLLFMVGVYRGQLRKGRILWSDWKHAMSISLPASWAAALTHALWLSEKYFASSLDPGTISALSYGQRIVNFTAGGLTFATSTLLLPHLSAWIEAGERNQAALFNRRTINGMTVCAVAGVILMLVGGEWLVRLAFARGKFDESAIALTTTAVWLYLGVFVAYLYGVIITPNALAMNERTLIVATSAASLLFYLALTPVLVKAFGFKGLPLSASIAFILSLAVSMAVMWRRHPDFYWRPVSQKLTIPVTPKGDT